MNRSKWGFVDIDDFSKTVNLSSKTKLQFEMNMQFCLSNDQTPKMKVFITSFVTISDNHAYFIADETRFSIHWKNRNEKFIKFSSNVIL